MRPPGTEHRAIAATHKNDELEARLATLAKRLEEAESATLLAKKEAADGATENELLRAQNEELKQENDSQTKLLNELKKDVENSNATLTFDSLREGGILSKHVKAFTFFATVETNEAFVEMINFTDGSPGSCAQGDGLCGNLVRYSKISIDQRIKARQYYGTLAGSSLSWCCWCSCYFTGGFIGCSVQPPSSIHVRAYTS